MKSLEKEFLAEGREKEYRDLIDLIARIANYIFADSERAKKGIGEIMGGKVLELESDRLIASGERKAQAATATRMLQAGKYTMDEIVDISGLDMENVLELKAQQ